MLNIEQANVYDRLLRHVKCYMTDLIDNGPNEQSYEYHISKFVQYLQDVNGNTEHITCLYENVHNKNLDQSTVSEMVLHIHSDTDLPLYSQLKKVEVDISLGTTYWEGRIDGNSNELTDDEMDMLDRKVTVEIVE